MKTSIKIIFLLVFCSPLFTFAYDQQFSPDASYQVCFRLDGNGNCEQEIVDMINAAQSSIDIFAYSLSSQPIADAMLQAKNRGLIVRIIADPNEIGQQSDIFHSLVNACIPIWLENNLSQTPFPANAHNKVIIADGENVETGSYNYSYSAATRNTENIIFIHDKNLADQYENYWLYRQAHSTPVMLPPQCGPINKQ